MSRTANPSDHPLRQMRLVKGWTLAELADRAGVAVSTISRIESGQRRPTASTLAKLAQAIGNTKLTDQLAPWLDRDEVQP